MLHGMRFCYICIKLTKIWGSFLKSLESYLLRMRHLLYNISARLQPVINDSNLEILRLLLPNLVPRLYICLGR